MSDAVMVCSYYSYSSYHARAKSAALFFHLAHTENRPRHTDRADIVIGQVTKYKHKLFFDISWASWPVQHPASVGSRQRNRAHN